MIGTRHEEYTNYNKLPFILHTDITRTPYNCSKEKNWHENIEIELCTKGSGTVLLNGEKYSFRKNDIIAINSNVIHYTSTEESLTYTCLIISTEFCKQIGIDYKALQFTPLIKSDRIIKLLLRLKNVYTDKSLELRTPKLNKIIIEILIELAENHSTEKSIKTDENKAYENVKLTIEYIRENYDKKITLEKLAKAIYTDKYALCHDFKKISAQTIIEYTNNYRCQKAAELISHGYTVAEASAKCGFNNLSYFTKTFKSYMGVLPSKYIKIEKA